MPAHVSAHVSIFSHRPIFFDSVQGQNLFLHIAHGLLALRLSCRYYNVVGTTTTTLQHLKGT